MTPFATPILTDRARGTPYRSGFRPIPAVMPPEGASLPARLLGTCRGWLHSAPGFFHSFQSFALKLCNQPRDLVIQSCERLCVSSFQNIPFPFVQFILGKFQWKRKSLPTIQVTA